MREILFRGKRVDNNKWVYGYLIKTFTGKYFILTGEDEGFYPSIYAIQGKILATEYFYEVIPETVGMKSEHELGLFEGDIVNFVTGNPKMYVTCIVKFGEYETYTHFNKEEGDVEKHNGFYIEHDEYKEPLCSLWLALIGNVHSDPELLQSTIKQP